MGAVILIRGQRVYAYEGHDVVLWTLCSSSCCDLPVHGFGYLCTHSLEFGKGHSQGTHARKETIPRLPA